ncbi:MAG: aminopeptidase YwaD [Arenicella sp.]|jgi:aminopeptidase YwaD
MKNHFLLLFGLICLNVSLSAQSPTDSYLKQIRPVFSAENAYNTTAFVEKHWRVVGNEGFNSSIYYVKDVLEKAGFVNETQNPTKSNLTYRIEKREMKLPTWQPISGSLQIEGDETILLDFASNRNMICINSHSTPKEGITAEVVDTEAEDWKGKIVFVASSSRAIYKKAHAKGAIGVLAYNMPDYTQPKLYQNSIQFGSIPNLEKDFWAVMLSYQAMERIRTALGKGKTELKVNLQTKRYKSEELTLIAQVKGSEKPDEEFVISAHVQEPGANDNASGVGVLAEIARSCAQLNKQNQLKRTLTFLWGDEIVSTERYVKAHRKNIWLGMSLDMVGEDTEKTGGSFLIEKMPDPSAIWTRGEDKHTEWGAGNVTENDLFPHFFNDFAIGVCQTQGKFANWKVNTNPFEGGSDHTPFLKAGIPGLLFWHFTDAFYHTDNDRIDKVSKKTLLNVGISTFATAVSLCNGSEELAEILLGDLEKQAMSRLEAESALSQKLIEKGESNAVQETQILSAWGDWYRRSVLTLKQIPTKKMSKKLEVKINEVAKKIELKTKEMVESSE